MGQVSSVEWEMRMWDSRLELTNSIYLIHTEKNSRTPTTWEESNLSVGPWVSCQGLSRTQGHRKRRDCVAAQVTSHSRGLCFKCFSGRQSLWAIAQQFRLSLTWSQAMDVSPGTISHRSCQVSGEHNGKSCLRVVQIRLGSWLGSYFMVWCMVQAVVIHMMSDCKPESYFRALTSGAAFWSLKGWSNSRYRSVSKTSESSGSALNLM